MHFKINTDFVDSLILHKYPLSLMATDLKNLFSNFGFWYTNQCLLQSLFFTLWLYMCFGIKHSISLIHVVVVAVVVVWSHPPMTPWTSACQASLSFAISQSLLKFMSIESVMPSNHLILCGLLVLLPSIFSRIRVYSNESALCIRWPKYWSFSFSISPSNEYSGLISFRIHCLDLLAVQGTLKSLLQHHSSKASILWCSAFFIVQLSHPYMTSIHCLGTPE